MDPAEGGDGRLLAVAELGVQRKPGPDRPWTFAEAIEQDLIGAAALAAADDDVVAHLDATAPVAGLDTGTAFARALVLASGSDPFGTRAETPGDAPADAAARTLRAPRPEARAAAADGLSLAPSPAVGPAVARLLDGAAPPLATAALGVLRFRRQAPYGDVVLLLAHPDAAVAGAAARCLGTVPQRRAAASVLRHVLARGPDDARVLPVAETLLALGDPAGLAFVRHKLETESASPSLTDDARVAYLRLLGLAGDVSDRDLFFRSVEPTARDAAAVGWYGHPDLIDWLLGSLEAAGEARRSGSSRGVPPNPRPGSRPSSFETAAVRSLQRVLGGPDSLGADGPPWRARWAEVRAELLPTTTAAQKLRFGRPYTPAATLDELEAEAVSGNRADAALELAIVTGGAALLETDDWIARQRSVLAAARLALSTGSTGGAAAYPAGAFVGSRLATR